MLFEIRVIDGRWCLDAFSKSGTGQKALLDRTHLHPLGEWYRVAAVYDGKQFRSYVNGALDGAAEVRLAPQTPGRTAVGMRMNPVFAVARASRPALLPATQRLQLKRISRGRSVVMWRMPSATSFSATSTSFTVQTAVFIW